MMKKHCLKTSKNLNSFVKIFLLFAILGIFPSSTLAATSDTINFQGKIVRNDTGNEGLNVIAGTPSCVVAGSDNDTCDFQVSYYDSPSGGAVLLTETFTNIEIGEYNGAFNLSLGSDSTPTSGTYSAFEDMVVGEDDLYVQLAFDPTGANTFTETFSRMSVQATAYALKAKYASGADTAFQFDSAVDDSGYTSPSAGMVYYDSDESVLKMYNGSSWEDVTTGSGGSSLFSDGGDYTYLTSLVDHLVLGANSYTAIGSSTYDNYIDTSIGTMPPFAFDMGAERLTLSGNQQQSGLTVYSDYNGSSPWPLVSFKAESSGFTSTILELVQDGTGDIFSAKKGSTEVFKVDNNGALYLHEYTSFSGDTDDRLYNVNGTLYWDGSALGSGGGLWTDDGTFSYLTSTTDDLIIGGDSAANAKFFFDVSTGNLGIGTSTPNSKLDIGGSSSTISNSSGDLTISADDAVVIKANDAEADNLMEWHDENGNILSLINQNGYATFGSDTGNTSAMLSLGANTSSVAQINLASSTGTDVAAPNNGDLWWNGTNLYFYDGSDNIDLLVGGSGAGLFTEHGSVSNDGYLELVHDEDSFDLIADGWVCVGGAQDANCTGGNWKNVADSSLTIGHYLSNVWDDADSDGLIRSDVRLTNVELSPGIDVGTGADGDVTISSHANINTANNIGGRSCADGGDAVNYSITSFNTGGTEATLSAIPSSGCLNPGDEVLIINLQGTYTAYGNVGNYETLEIAGISGSTVTFKTPKMRYYGDGSSNDSNIGTSAGTQRVMLQRVPNYSDVTVNTSVDFFPSAWDGVKGGVMFFRSNGNVSINGYVHAGTKGYRGGSNQNSSTAGRAGGYGGESFSGLGGAGGTGSSINGGNGAAGGGAGVSNTNTRGTGGNGYTGGGGGSYSGSYPGSGSSTVGGAGGGGAAHVGGGGGGYGTAGTGGGTNASENGAYDGGSGGSYGTEDLSKLLFGSGGGGGGNWNNHTPNWGGNGGAGGGIVYIGAENLVVSGNLGSFGASGENGYGCSSTRYNGGGGAGAGGSVKLEVVSANIGTGLVNVNGGVGGSGCANGSVQSYGKNSGVGRIAIYYVDDFSGSTFNSNVTNSYNATYSSYGLYHSPVINTPNAKTYDSVKWNEYLDTYGNISVQTRSGEAETREKGLDFDGDGDYLSTDNTQYNFTTQNFTLEAWVKPSADRKGMPFVNGSWNTDGYYVAMWDEGGIGFVTNQSGAYQTTSTAADVMVSDEWQHIAIVRNGATATIYRNGIDVTSTHGTHINPASSSSGLWINSYHNTDEWYGSNSMDEIRIWNDARTQTEIQNNMNVDLTGSEANLAGYWPLDEMSGGTTENKAVIGDDMSIYNASWTEFYDWEEWKPFSLTTNYLMLESMDTHTNWGGTNMTIAENDIADYTNRDSSRNVKMFEDEDEGTLANMTLLTSSTDGGYAESTISSTDLSTYDYVTAWVRVSESGNTIKLGMGETSGSQQEETVTIDEADEWQKIYWDISDVDSSDRDGITKLRVTNLSGVSNTIYLDNIRAEKLRDTDKHMKVESTPNDYFQYRVIFTTTNTSYQPRLENITLSYNSGYDIVLVDSNTVRLHNYSGEDQYLKLDVATGAVSGTTGGGTGDGFANGIATSDVANGQDAVAFTFNTSETFSDPSSKLLSVMNNDVEKMYLDADGNLYVSGAIISEKGMGTTLTNNSGGTIAKNSLVTIDTSTNAAFTTTTTENQQGAFGVVQGVDVNNDTDKDGNCDNGDQCFVIFDGATEVTTVDANLASVGDYVFSSTTAGSAKADGEQANGMIGIVASTADAASGYLTIVFDTQNQYMADLYLNGLIEKDLYRDMFRNLSTDYASMTLAERRGDIEDGSQAVLFDTFVDALKMDLENSTVGLDEHEDRAGLWGDLDITTGSTDIAGNYFMGSSSAVYSTSIYYDRSQTGEQGQDSAPSVLVDLGIDPNWFNGVSLQSNCTVNCSVNSNLSTTYNGDLFEIAGTYGTGSEHGSILIEIIGHTASGITANVKSTDGTCTASSASLTYGSPYTFNAGSCSGADITITPTSADFNIGDTFKVASWLVEPSTSNDRGIKRQFPERSIIIGSEDASVIYVTIVDADTQRVWMTFVGDDAAEATANMLVSNTNSDIGTMDMLNGQLSVGGYGSTGDTSAMNIDFVDDTAFAYDNTYRYEYDSVIADRNDGDGYSVKDNTTTVYSPLINDVDMEVIDDVEGTRALSQSGWGYVNNTVSGVQTAIGSTAFPESFWGSPDITLTTYGYAGSLNPTSLASCSTGWSSFDTTLESATGDGMDVKVTRTDGSNLTAGHSYCFTWEASGEKATAKSQKMYTAWASRDAVSLVNNTEMNAGHVTWEAVTTNDYEQVLIDPIRSTVWIGWDWDGDTYARVSSKDIDTFVVDNSLETFNSIYAGDIQDFSTNSSPKLSYQNDYTEVVMSWKTGNLFTAGDKGVDMIGKEGDDWFVKRYTGSYFSEYIYEGTQGYWPLELGDGYWDHRDASMEYEHFTLENVDSNDAISGVRGKGASLNGTDESMCVTTADIDGQGDMSLFAWYKSSSSAWYNFSQYNSVSSIGDGWIFDVNSSGGLHYFSNDNGWSSGYGSGLTDNNWHHIGIVKTALDITFYIDGQHVGSEVITDINTPSGNAFCIGRGTEASQRYAPMDVDEVIISDELLSDDQIQKMYQSGKKALTGSHEIDDTYNKLLTNNVQSIMVDPDENFMYVGTTGQNLQKVDLTSDTIVSRETVFASNNVERINGRYTPVFLGDSGNYGEIRAVNTNGAGTLGTYYSKTFAIEENATNAYLWMKAYSDSGDSSSDITVSVSNDGGSTYESAVLVSTQPLSNGETEYEYSIDFDNPNNDIKVKIEMDRAANKKSTIYVSEWGLATLENSDITGNGMFTGTDASIANGDYLEVVHNQNTYNVIATGWVKEDGQWVELKNPSISAGQYLSNVWGDADPDGIIRSDVRLTNLELSSGLDIGTGADGDVTIVSDTNINTANSISGRSCTDGGDAVSYNITAFNAGGTEATLSAIPSGGCLNVGDEVLIMNLQGVYAAYGNTGNYETLRVANVSGSTVTFETPKVNYYGNGTSDDTNLGTTTANQRVILQRVPNYNDVTLNSGIDWYPSTWNGTNGGVFFFRANGTVNISGNIDVDGIGFRGATGYQQDRGGDGGEAYCGPGGLGATSSVDGGDGAGGGGNRSTNSTAGGYGYCGGGGGGRTAAGQGGDGGAGGGAGGRNAAGGGAGYGSFGYGGGASTGFTGSNGGINTSGDGGLGSNGSGGGGGGTYGDDELSKLYLGSGGGAGGGYTDSTPGGGGDGGGIIVISANDLDVSGVVSSDGTNGGNSGSRGGGGGASGGSVKLSANTMDIGTGNITVNNGNGGTGPDGTGGAGGDGRIAIYYLDGLTGTTANAGVTNSYDASYSSYGLYHSPVMETPDSQSYDYLKWEEDLDQYGEIGIQTRSGSLDSEREYMEFDGEGQYLTSSTIYDYTSEDFTIEFWVKPETVDGSIQILFANGAWNGSGYFSEINAQNAFAFYTSQSGAVQNTKTADNSVQEGVWQHVAFVRSGANVTIYIDGVDSTSVSGTHIDPITSTRDLEIGDKPTVADRELTGGMDEIRIWSEARTQTDIQNNMNTELTGSETNLAGYWNMNDTKSNTVTDSTSSGNDLTIAGAKRNVDREYTWESWKPFAATTNYISLDNANTHTNWTGTNVTVSENTDSGTERDIEFFEDEDESTNLNMTKLASSTDGGYAESTITSTDISGYDYITAWVRASQSGNTLKLGIGETTGNEQEEQITIDKADKWQKVYWDISDIDSADKDAITKLRFTNLTGTSNNIYIDNVQAEKLVTENNSMRIGSTPNDYFQYRVIFTTTNTAYQPKLENISLTYGGGGYEIILEDENTARLYNHTGQDQELRLDIVVGQAILSVQTGGAESISLAPTIAQVDLSNGGNSIWINKADNNGNLLRLQTQNNDMFVVDSGGNLTMNGDLEVEGGILSLGTSGDQGSIRYNATNDQLEFTNNGTDWMVLGGMSKTETLSAEYAGATISEDGTDNVGTMTSDSEGSSSDSMNYYEWNSSEVSLNDYDIRVRFTLPSDFDSWGIGGGITLNYATESTSSSANQVDFYVYEESSATVDASSEDLASSIAGEWTTSTISGTSLTDCDTAGEVCVLVIRMSSSGDNYVRIGDIEFTYDRSL